MRGFALTDTLIAMAVLTMLLVLVLTRSVDVQTEELRRARHAWLIDSAQAALQLSQHETVTGTFRLLQAGEVGSIPSARYAHLQALLETFRFPDASLVLTLSDPGVGRVARVDALIESHLVFSEEVQWSDNVDS